MAFHAPGRLIMSSPIRRLSTSQFRLLLPDAAALTRKIDSIHLHHTWKPSHGEFRGLATIEAMRRFHLSLGWADIAQHVTIDPEGGVWTGRNWNLPPASVRGHNGTTLAGPFMIEIVGNFDEGRDLLDGAQLDAAVQVVAHVLETFALGLSDVKLHRELVANAKSCPGSAFDRVAFEKRVRTAALAKAAPSSGVFSREFLAGASVALPTSVVVSEEEREHATVPEHPAAAMVVEREARRRIADSQRRYSSDFARLFSQPSSSRGVDWSELKPHVVNLSRGELSESGGEFTTTPVDLDGIIDSIRDHAAADPSLRVLLYAHGGLVGEADALAYAKSMYRWWLSKGVYPVFFVWETGLLEILRQRLFGARDIWDWTSDAAIELAAKGPGTLIWSEMKNNARRASAPDLGEGYPGGAHLFATKLGAFLKTTAASGVSVHAIGHSAGAIFHSHLLPVLLQLGAAKIETLSLLAPAVRTELFTASLEPLIRSARIAKHTCFTMEEEAEEQDNCWNVYRKSLLYLVSRSFEGLKRRPILGLHQSIYKDAVLRDLYGIDKSGRPVNGASPLAEIQFSYARDKAENPLTRALAHGAFDNDPKTMSAALRRILHVGDGTGFGEDDFPYPALPRTFETVPVGPAPIGGAAPVVIVSTSDGEQTVEVDAPPDSEERIPTAETTGPDGTREVRRALCVGIDEYRDQPLEGCVNDSKAWGRVLANAGFKVTYLHNEQATNRRIQQGLADLISGARSGDILAFQYSGHGTQIPDDNGDETDSFDEAFVPVDYDKGELLLRDDVVAKALDLLPEGVTLTLFMDCCHCGTNSRFAPRIRATDTGLDRVRFMPPEYLGLPRAPRVARTQRRALPSSAPGVIHFAACRDDEYAWESRGQGDFTAAATAFLADAITRRDTNETFIKQVGKIVAAKKRQHPLMLPPARGMAGRPILSGRGASRPPAPPPSPSSASLDRQLLEHLEAAVSLLKERVDRGSET
jgi:hypothetical protein